MVRDKQAWWATFLTNAIILGSGLLGGILVARLLGPEDRGLLAAIIYWPHFIVGVGCLGLNEGIVLHTARKGIQKNLVSTIFWTSLCLAAVFGGTGFLLIPSLLGEGRSSEAVFSQLYYLLFLPSSFLAMNLLAVEQGRLNFRLFNRARIIQAASYPLLLLVLAGASRLTVHSGAYAVMAGPAIVACWQAIAHGRSLLFKPSLSLMGRLFSESLRLHLVNVILSLSSQLDRMVLILFSSNSQLGLYVVAITAASATSSLLVQTFINIMLPTAARAGRSTSPTDTNSAPLKGFILLTILSIALLWPALPFLLELFFGKEFKESSTFARILLVAFGFSGIKQVLIYLLRAHSIHMAALKGETITVVTLSIAALIGVQFAGTTGLCWAVVLAQAAGTFIMFHYFIKLTAPSAKDSSMKS